VKARQAGSSGLALFAEELIAARTTAGMSQEDLAARLSYSLSLEPYSLVWKVIAEEE
jgi:hypothetical protein